MSDNDIDKDIIKLKASVDINSVIAADVSVINIINNARFLKDYIYYLGKLININKDDLNNIIDFLDNVNEVATSLHYAFKEAIDVLNKNYSEIINGIDDEVTDYIM